MKKVIIVGAGIGGLVSAIKLKHHGYDVTVIEKNERIGGKINQIKKDGFTFDMGPTIVMMPELYDEVFKYVGKDPNDYFTKTQLSPTNNIYFSLEDKVEVNTDLVQIAKIFEGMNEKEASGYLSYIDDIYERYVVSNEHILEKTSNKLSSIFNPKTLWDGFKLKTFDNTSHSVSKIAQSDHLRKLLSFQTLFIGISPYSRPSNYSANPMIETLYGIWFFKGGMYGYIQGLEKLMNEMGIKIITNTTVDEIFITNGQAKGVVIGEDIFCADIVINNTDFPYAMKNLVKNEKHRPRYTNKKLEKMDYSSSAFMMYLGLDLKLDHLNVHNSYLSSDFEGNIKDIFSATLPKTPSMYFYVPSKLDPSLAPANHEALYILVPVPSLKGVTQSWDKSFIQNFRKVVLNRIASENMIENLEDHIVSETILTPKDWESEVHAHYGATFGLAPTRRLSNDFRPQPKFKGIQHFYHTGSSIHLGAGIPIVMMNAQLCVNEVLKHDPNGEPNACSVYSKEYENA
ncbi:MAG: phytoene desaturase [Erysipelothrix sp.]|jgi:phytoene desaturase|nr:phytoene desaturase [Erysipelothrix sp.]